MTESLLEQLRYIQESLDAGEDDNDFHVDAGQWLVDGADFELFAPLDDIQREAVSHAVGYVRGVSDALDTSIAELLDEHALLDPQERAIQVKLAESRAERAALAAERYALAANVRTAPTNKQGVRDLSALGRSAR